MRHQTKVILGGFMGNVVEAYDISICYFLSQALSRHLLGDNQGNPTVVLTLIFIAYLAKPIGAFVLGMLSDLYGRKSILMVSILLMGISTALIGLIPNHSQIGFLAPLCLLSLRIIQSMALGAEFLNSASFLVESGDNRARGFRGCWSSVGVKVGYLVACAVVELSQSAFFSRLGEEWLWRLPFLLAIITTMAGLYVRYLMPESLAYVLYYAEHKKPSTQDIYRASLNLLKSAPFLFNYAFFASFLAVATGFFFYLYIPLHALAYSHLSKPFIMESTMISLTLVSVLIPLFGYLSDRQDRLTMLAAATGVLLVLAYPFMQVINYGNAAAFLTMQLLVSVACACYYSVSTVLLTELFPMTIRCTALSIVYSIAASLAAGLPPLLSEYLIKITGQPNSPAYIMIVLTLIVLANIRILSENYRLGVNQYRCLNVN